MLLVEVERLGVGPRGLLFLAEPLIGEAPTGPGVQAVRLDRHRIVEIARRGFGVAEREPAEAARDIGLGLLLDQPDRGREIVDRELVLSLRLIEQTAIVIGLPVAG